MRVTLYGPSVGAVVRAARADWGLEGRLRLVRLEQVRLGSVRLDGDEVRWSGHPLGWRVTVEEVAP